MNKTKYIIITLVTLLVFSFVGIFYMFYKTKTSTVEDVAKKESQEILNMVSKAMLLPTDEIPGIATVSDPKQLNNQEFFANAITGDKVLVYQKLQKAILWRPSIKKIIEVSYFDPNQQNRSQNTNIQETISTTTDASISTTTATTTKSSNSN